LPMVVATLVEIIAPAKFSTAAIMMADSTERAGRDAGGDGVGGIMKPRCSRKQCRQDHQTEHQEGRLKHSLPPRFQEYWASSHLSVAFSSVS
jgi:hypothetical protein